MHSITDTIIVRIEPESPFPIPQLKQQVDVYAPLLLSLRKTGPRLLSPLRAALVEQVVLGVLARLRLPPALAALYRALRHLRFHSFHPLPSLYHYE